MIRSMTGYGAASRIIKGVVVSVEIRSLNSRFLDARFRLPKHIEPIEEEMNQKVRQACARGRITVVVSFELSKNVLNGKLELDGKRLQSYRKLKEQVNKEYNFDIELSDLVDLRDLIISDKPIDIPEKSVMSVLDKALSELNQMRSIEGKALGKDILKRVAKMKALLNKTRILTIKNAKKLKNEYREKIQAILEVASMDDSRIIMEAAVLSEKADVTEECVRCASHLDQISALFEREDPVGKRLNFLLQEVVREINTIGSKSPNLDIINYVVDLKEETEKVKEQVQNIL